MFTLGFAQGLEVSVGICVVPWQVMCNSRIAILEGWVLTRNSRTVFSKSNVICQ